MGVRIKICGITRFEDARIAANLGVDALGFIFFKKSPRYIAPEDAAEIIRQLPPFISRVGVFVNEELPTVLEIARIARIDTLQLHGSESPDFCNQSPLPVLKAFSVKPDMDFDVLDTYKTAGFLLDTWNGNMYGGSGKTFNWTIAKNICSRFNNVIIAGGLGTSNIEEALDMVHPYGVDINSSVEIMPGVKNPHKMRDVIKIIKNWKAV
jgi:phosphoribosylanthranilate isomerase